MAKASYADDIAASLRSRINALPGASNEAAPSTDMEPSSEHDTGGASKHPGASGGHLLDTLAFTLATLSLLALFVVVPYWDLRLRLPLAVSGELALLNARHLLLPAAPRWLTRVLVSSGWLVLTALAALASLVLVVVLQSLLPAAQAAQAGDAYALGRRLLLLPIECVALGIPTVLGHAYLVTALRRSAMPRSSGRTPLVIGLAAMALLALAAPTLVALVRVYSYDPFSSSPVSAFDWLALIDLMRHVSLFGAGVLLGQLLLWDSIFAQPWTRVRRWQWAVEAAALVILALATPVPHLDRLIPAGLVIVAAVVQRERLQLLAHVAAALAFILLVTPSLIPLVALGLLLGLPAALTRQARLAAAAEIGFLLFLVYATQIFFFSFDPRVAFSAIILLWTLALAQGVLLAALRVQIEQSGYSGQKGEQRPNTSAILAVAAAFGMLTVVIVVGTGLLTVVAVFQQHGLEGIARSVFLLLTLLLSIVQVTLIVLAVATLWRLRGRRPSPALPAQPRSPEEGVTTALHRQKERLSALTEWLTEDPELRNLVDVAISRQVAAMERRQQIYGVTMAIASLIAGWLLSLFATTDALAHLGQGLLR